MFLNVLFTSRKTTTNVKSPKHRFIKLGCGVPTGGAAHTFLSRWRSILVRASVSPPGHTAEGRPSMSKPETLNHLSGLQTVQHQLQPADKSCRTWSHAGCLGWIQELVGDRPAFYFQFTQTDFTNTTMYYIYMHINTWTWVLMLSLSGEISEAASACCTPVKQIEEVKTSSSIHMIVNDACIHLITPWIYPNTLFRDNAVTACCSWYCLLKRSEWNNIY